MYILSFPLIAQCISNINNQGQFSILGNVKLAVLILKEPLSKTVQNKGPFLGFYALIIKPSPLRRVWPLKMGPFFH